MRYYPQVKGCQAEGNIYVKGKEKLTRTPVVPSRLLAKDWRLLVSARAPGQREEGHQASWNMCVQKNRKTRREKGVERQWKTRKARGGSIIGILSSRGKGTCTSIKKKYKQRMRKEVKRSSHLSPSAGFQMPPPREFEHSCNLQTPHTHLNSPSHSLLSFWNYHTSLLGIVIFIFPHSSSPFLEVDGIMLFRPRHDSNPLLFAIIWETFLYWTNSSLHDRARVQYQCSVLNHSSSNHRFIQIFIQNYGKTFYRVNKFHHFQIIF